MAMANARKVQTPEAYKLRHAGRLWSVKLVDDGSTSKVLTIESEVKDFSLWETWQDWPYADESQS